LTARLKGNHRATASPLRLSPELQALFNLVGTLAGDQGIFSSGAARLVQTMAALKSVGFRYNEAALILRESPESVRQRVHRIRERAMTALREINFSIQVRPAVEANMEHWQGRAFDWHAELSKEPAEEELEESGTTTEDLDL
jgi:hypothetical protein